MIEPEQGLTCSAEEDELNRAIQAVLSSTSRKKLVVAGPGTGKTTLFRKVLERLPGAAGERIVLTFINALKDDLEKDLSELATVHTLHSFCLGLLKKHPQLRRPLTGSFRILPGLAALIAGDWELIVGGTAPKFVGQMRNLAADGNLEFYLGRGNYYDAADFDDCVYRTYCALSDTGTNPPRYELVLIDEYQDFNALEAGVIDVLGEVSPLLVAGDDDQALYSQLRDASCEYIRDLSLAGNFEVFTLPFCMRCPQVIVDAVGDIVTTACRGGLLDGRIAKPYKHFPPVKGADSEKYPRIVNVQTSVQSTKANYMGRYIEEQILRIPEDETKEAAKKGYPAALVIVAKPYRDQIVGHLQERGYSVEEASQAQTEARREVALELLGEDSESNLGWRILLEVDRPDFWKDAIRATADGITALASTIPSTYSAAILAEAAEDRSISIAEQHDDRTGGAEGCPSVRVTSFEGAKGLSAAHVFIAGLHDGELPHRTNDIKDLEVCKFIVGLTRTRKLCSLIHCGRFGTGWKKASTFIGWIREDRLQKVSVDKTYWTQRSSVRSSRSQDG